MNDPSSVSQQPPQAPATAANTPATNPTAPDTIAAPVTPANPSQNPPSAQPQQQNPANQQPGSQPSATVSNAPAAPIHPSVQKANIIRNVAETLAGGPRYKVTPNADGTVTRTRVPLSRGDILMALAMESISGALAGFSQKGPGAVGRAGEAGFQQVSEQQQQANAQAEAQAQKDADNSANALARRAQIFEANSRALLNTSEAEQRGADAIDKLVDINRQSGVLDIAPELLDNAGQPMTQAELMDAMKAGRISPTDQLGPVAGRVEVTNPDGTKRWEATHLIVRDPSTKVPLTQADWDYYASQGVPGYPPGTKIGQGIQVKLSTKQIANETAAAHYLANQRLSDLRSILDGTQFAKQVPASVDFSKPGVVTAVQRFQRYVSHDAQNLGDLYMALQQMAADKRDPKTDAMQPNPDAKYVDTVAQTFGGWPLLQAAHDQIAANKKMASDFAVIDSADKANGVLSAPKRFTPDKVQAAKTFLQLANEQGERKAAQDARARAVAEGTDVQAMYKYGRNPITGEQLSLDNAPDSMLVSASGQVIPQDLVSTYKPTSQERQTADTARQVLAISADLQKELQKNPNLAGPLSGRSKQGLAKLGYGDAQAQKFLDDISFLQSAATKMHTGRFSNEILKKMGNLIQPGMNDQQFLGALSSINDVAGRYAQEDRLITVGDLKQMQNGVQRISNRVEGNNGNVIPAGAQPVLVNGKTTGYVQNGRYTAFGGQ